MSLTKAEQFDDTLRVDLWPRSDEEPRFAELCLMDTRAADNIRISYDFERDGWVIEQASRFRWKPGDEVCDPGWKEAAFIPAWQFDEKAGET